MRRFVWLLALGVAILSITPFLYGLAHTPPGSRYIGFQYNVDDEMVYAAWMRQAMNGHFLFDNRFAIDPQPGLTIHLYFWLLGLLAKVTGIPWAAALARFVFGGLFVLLLEKFLRMVTTKENLRKLALVLVCFGAGFGFLVWQALGVDFLVGSSNPLKGLLLGHLPNDVWQPEGFVFSSLLTNSLFSVSLCLILGVLICVVEARDSWKPVLPGAIGMLLLMNVHSYDVLLLVLFLVGLLVATIVQKQLTGVWLARVVLIGLGAIPSALWFLYVLKHDPVFQARANTLTYTENFRSILGGYGLMMLFAGIGGVIWIKQNPGKKRLAFGVALVAAGLILMFLLASNDETPGYWIGLGSWILLYVSALALVGLLARPRPAVSLILSWALVGLVAPYFPGLFERKLMMGLSIPWAVLAAAGIWILGAKLKESERRMVVGLCGLLLCATSFRWLGREFELINKNDSNTTLHAPYLSRDAARIIDYLNSHIDDKPTGLIAMPGIPASLTEVAAPFLPDLNPILSGFTGVYTFAGHWSETPDYNSRRGAATAFFTSLNDSERPRLLAGSGLTYVVAPGAEKIAAILKATGSKTTFNPEAFGKVVVAGKEWQLIQGTELPFPVPAPQPIMRPRE